eukprot:614225_1
MDTIHKQPQLDINTDYKFIMNTNRQLTITCISRNNSYTANWLYAVGFNRNMRCISLMPWPSNAIEHMQWCTQYPTDSPHDDLRSYTHVSKSGATDVSTPQE